MQLNYKIVITGGTGRFGSILKNIYKSDKLFFPNKNDLNILLTNSIENYLKNKKPKVLIHLAGLSRPMKIHDSSICQSIDLNIIGTANIVKICSKLKIKLIYFSTNYVYPGTRGNYKENSPLLPINNYAWSKLGGESAVQLYKNSLILRVCMTEKPFVHKKAFLDFKTNFIFQEEIAKILFKVLPFKGIINLGGKAQSVYSFAKDFNKNISSISRSSIKSLRPYPDISMNISKLKKILKEYN
jgi:dTDP-4-dehydrorhamnose reductase